jgi:hypothetical protein
MVAFCTEGVLTVSGAVAAFALPVHPPVFAIQLRLLAFPAGIVNRNPLRFFGGLLRIASAA